MSKEVRNGWLAFLVPIIGLIVYGFIYKSCNDSNDNSHYLVDETGYFHSTNDKDKCRFIKSAKDGDYHIKKISHPEAVVYSHKICKECFTTDEQKGFRNEVTKMQLFRKMAKEHSLWMELDGNKDVDYNNLYVYIDSSNIFHIDGNCIMLKGNASRMRLSNVESIYDTCEDCVERWLCDFIYKAVYEGVYDKNVIKCPENDDLTEGYEDYDYLPEQER